MYGFIINPLSGNGSGLNTWNKVEQQLQQKGIKYIYLFTKKSNQTEEISILISDNLKAIVIIGGDGTFHKVINECKEKERITFGFIPAGSGNDLARSLSLPRDYNKGLEIILRGKTKTIDLVKANDTYCVTVLGVGFDAFVARGANVWPIKKWLNRLRLGILTYACLVFVGLARYKPTRLEVEIDGKSYQFDRVWLLAVGNFPYYGGGMKICPDAKEDDGFLNICVVSGLSRISLLWLFPSVFKGNHIKRTQVKNLKGKQVSIQSSPPVLFQGDGEVIGESPIKLSICPNIIRIIH